jgi:hypothetical protein
MGRLGLAHATLLATGLVSAMSAEAQAEFDDAGFELEDLSASTLRDGELSLGLREVALGLFGVLQVGVAYPLAAVGAPNAHVEATVFTLDPFALSLDLGVLRFDPESLGFDEDFDLWAVPIALRASGRMTDDLRLHGTVDVVLASPSGEAPELAKRLARHFFPSARVGASLAAEYRLGRHVAAVAKIEVPLVAPVAALRNDDEDSAFDFLRATLGLHCVFGDFNLRLSAGYGPSILGPSAGFFPALELALRIP